MFKPNVNYEMGGLTVRFINNDQSRNVIMVTDPFNDAERIRYCFQKCSVKKNGVFFELEKMLINTKRRIAEDEFFGAIDVKRIEQLEIIIECMRTKR